MDFTRQSPDETPVSGKDLMAEAKALEKNLLNFFWRQGVSPSESEDLVQETYLRLWRHRADYRPTAKLSTFLFLLARQVRIDALRRQERRERREEEWASLRPQTVEAARFGVREDVRWALSRLSDPLREVVELGVLQDLPYAQVAEVLGIPVGTVKSRMHNALKELREIFNERRS